jgi:hypothetical protein
MFERFVQFLRLVIHHRMGVWLWINLAMLAAVAIIAPHLLPVSLYKLSLITIAAWLAYWLDRALFPYARPDKFMQPVYSLGAPNLLFEQPGELAKAIGYAAAMLRRALIIAAAMLACALGA